MNHFEYQVAARTILADLYTPVGVYLSLRSLYPQSVLMESSDYHSHDTARSFVAIHPMASFAVSHGVVIATLPDGSEQRLQLDLEHKGKAKEQVAQALSSFSAHFMYRAKAKSIAAYTDTHHSMRYAILKT